MRQELPVIGDAEIEKQEEKRTLAEKFLTWLEESKLTLMEITQKDASHILNWLLDASFRNPNCLYTLYERELVRKLIDFADNKIGYPSIERRIAQSIQPDKRWLPQGRTTDAQDYIKVG